MSVTITCMNPSNAPNFERLRALSAAGITAVCSVWLLRWAPHLEIDCFAQGSARLASLLLDTTVARVDAGWLLPTSDLQVLVSTACSATDFYAIVGALIAWQCARRGHRLWRATLIGFIGAAPIAIGVNALRVVAVMQAHRWVIPTFPDSLHASLHLLTGVAVFLPALVALNLLFEYYGRIARPTLDRA